MKEITTTVYTFDELSPEAKERAREWWRINSTDYDWWSDTYDDSRQVLTLLGFWVDDITFSGFYSQGDGARFRGSWYASDVKPAELSAYAPNDETIARITATIADYAQTYPEAYATIKYSGHYEHEYCTDIDVYDGDEDTRNDELPDTFRACMRWVYAMLNREYEWLMSDECVDESIQANGYDFTIYGHLA